MTKPKFRVERFEKASHDRGAFSCGVTGMDRWFKESITDQIMANRLRVWCALDAEGHVVGFYGLSAHSVEAEASPALSRRRERHPIPAVYLAALATDLSVQGEGLGGALMADALAKALEVSETIGAAAVILDVFEDERFEQRMAFYTKLGFRPLNPSEDPKRLFLPIKAVLENPI
ncbi:MAG: GNAT family N-acetyltransferase [Shimia sp.]|nr:GNAT family N-acetyltransferase [Shimia sp.]